MFAGIIYLFSFIFQFYNQKITLFQECFNSPYGVKHFPEYAELVPDGPSSIALSSAARETGRIIIGGIINTCH